MEKFLQKEERLSFLRLLLVFASQEIIIREPTEYDSSIGSHAIFDNGKFIDCSVLKLPLAEELNHMIVHINIRSCL